LSVDKRKLQDEIDVVECGYNGTIVEKVEEKRRLSRTPILLVQYKDDDL
jgi:hypothetical protein